MAKAAQLKDQPPGVHFGDVLAALKEGQSAKRNIWPENEKIYGIFQDGKMISMEKLNAYGKGRFHAATADLLAEDWEVIS